MFLYNATKSQVHNDWRGWHCAVDECRLFDKWVQRWNSRFHRETFHCFKHRFHFSYLYVISLPLSAAQWRTNNSTSMSGPQTSCTTYILHCLPLTTQLSAPDGQSLVCLQTTNISAGPQVHFSSLSAHLSKSGSISQKTHTSALVTLTVLHDVPNYGHSSTDAPRSQVKKVSMRD